MEDLVVLIIFALIIIFNFILKKIAGTARKATGEEVQERPRTRPRNHSHPEEEIRAFLNGIKSQAQKTESAPNQGRHKSASGQGGPVSQRADDRPQQIRPKETRSDSPLRGHGRQPELQAPRTTPGEDDTKDRLAETHRKSPPSAPGIPQYARGTSSRPSRSPLGQRLGTNRSELRKAVVMSEVLGKPVGMRGL